MNTTAFVAATPVLARSSPVLSTSSLTSRRSTVSQAPRPARIVMSADNDQSIPQGFTSFSENLNGRAAMVGFVLAVVTEAITGQGIVGQIESVAKIFEVVSPFN